MSIFNKIISTFSKIEASTKTQLLAHKKFYLVSAAGMPNYGDDMLTRGWINFITRHYPNCDIYLDAVDPVVAKTFFPDVNCVNYFWTLAQALGIEGSIAEKFSDPLLLPIRERFMLRLFPEIESFHLIGGGYINDFSGANSRLIELISFFSEKFKIPCFATGLGLSPLSKTHASRFSDSINQYDFFDVRDASSFNVLNEFSLSNLSFVGDDYFCFPFEENVRLIDTETPALRLCLNNEAVNVTDAEEKLLDFIGGIIEKYRAKHDKGEIVFYEFRPGVDGEFYKLVKARHAQVKFLPFDVIWLEGLTFSPRDYFVSTRFHFQLIVASMGLTGISFYWNEYYKNKFSSLEVVSNWISFNIGEQSETPLEVNLEDFTNLTPRFTHEFSNVRDKKLKIAFDIYPSN